MFLYLHGFRSSPLSTKAQQFRQWLAKQGREAEWICPTLPYDPQQAIVQLGALIESTDSELKLVGSSLGGFYATVLSARYDLKAVVINPAVHAGLVLCDAVGPQSGWHGDEAFEFTQAHVDALNAMDLLAPKYPEKILLMQETGDEVLNWRTAVDFYRDSHQLVFRGGDHSFTHFTDVMELIERF